MSPSFKAHAQMHLCVLLWGFTAILGKLISLPALPMVWWRLLLVVLALLAWPRVWRGLRRLRPRMAMIFSALGVVLSLHWLTFYEAIKAANASVGVTCIATAPVFVSLLEPLVSGRRLARTDLLLGLVVIPGIALFMGGVPMAMFDGVALGVLSALLVAVFGVFNKRYVEHADVSTITAVEFLSGLATLSLIGALWPQLGTPWVLPGGRDLSWLLLLAGACTLLPFMLSLVALRHLSAFSAQIAINLEPIYAVLLAMLIFGEQRELGPLFYLGLGIVLAVVLIYPLFAARAATVDPLGLPE